MMEYPLTQSSWGRAGKDTRSGLNTISFWVVEVISAPIVAYGMYLAIPSSASGVIKTIVPITAFSVWMLAMLGGVFLLSLLVAPYRQRNQARRLILAQRKVPLPNRDSLIRAMLAVQEKAINVKMCRDHLNLKEKNKEDSQKEFYKLSDAWIAYYDATQVLENEQMLAGDHFKGIVLGWLSFVNYHVDDCMGYLKRVKNKPEPLKTTAFMGQIKDYTEWTIRELDGTNLRVLDKVDSQA